MYVKLSTGNKTSKTGQYILWHDIFASIVSSSKHRQASSIKYPVDQVHMPYTTHK